jgi:hypothetical protein
MEPEPGGVWRGEWVTLGGIRKREKLALGVGEGEES